MIQKICISMLCCFLLHINGFAQLKYEREYRLKKERVPQPAREFLDSCQFSSKIIWYGEESLEGHSIEAKVKEQQVKYSIEFDTLGTLQDVEVDVKWDQVPEAAQHNISTYLNEVFEKHKFIKIQLQWTGEKEAMWELIRKGKSSRDFTLKYEIVLKGKLNKKAMWYEFLFSDKGQFERKATIIFRNTDNLEF